MNPEENTKIVKNRKKKSLIKNVHKLFKMLGGPNVSQITRKNMKKSFRQKNANSADTVTIYNVKPRALVTYIYLLTIYVYPSLWIDVNTSTGSKQIYI
jgi:hypothetical protein